MRRVGWRWLCGSHGLFRAVSLAAAIISLEAAPAIAQLAVPQGVWLIDEKGAIQIFDCDGLMCGSILWLYKPRDAGIPLFGKTKTLVRIAKGVSDGWC